MSIKAMQAQLYLLESRRAAIEREVAAEWKKLIDILDNREKVQKKMARAQERRNQTQRIQDAIDKYGLDNISYTLSQAQCCRTTFYKYLKTKLNYEPKKRYGRVVERQTQET